MTEKNLAGGTLHYQNLEQLAAALVPESVKWIAELRNYRQYKGTDARYFQKARIGVSVLGQAVRICATIENAKTNDLIATRLLGAGSVKKLAS